MSLSKLRKDLKIAILVPAYCRPEYTQMCIEALESAQEYKGVCFYLVDDGSNDGTKEILQKAKLNKLCRINEENKGLRNILIDFIEWVKSNDFDMMGVIGNDCLVPQNWLNNLIDIFDKSDVQILSPNVFPSDAAHKYGKDKGLPYMPSKIVGGLWFMYTSLVKNIKFERYEVKHLTGAFNILKQILIEENPVVGWAPNVVVQDIGHWSAQHPKHIKTPAHYAYYQTVGRKVDW